MIKSFRDAETEALWNQEFVPKFQAIERFTRRKLEMLNQAETLKEFDTSGSRVEKLKGDRAGQYSIRINKQWRICFEWKAPDANEVEIADYH